MLFVLAVSFLPAFCVGQNPNPCKCGLSMDAGNTCAANDTSTRWFFNSITGMCERFVYNGCDGNANNFETAKECVETCRKDKKNICHICPTGRIPGSCNTACSDDCDCSDGNKCCAAACNDAPVSYHCVPAQMAPCEPGGK